MITIRHAASRRQPRQAVTVSGVPQRLSVIDLFAGAGGMSLGFEQAGFLPVLGLDDDERAITAYGLNFPGAAILAEDASDVTGSELLSAAGIDTCAVVVGGPPCAAFSVGGQRLRDDARRSWIGEFGRLVREIDPSYFVMENVPGILSPGCLEVVEQFVLDMKLGGYELCDPWVLSATDFGVPQRRRRVFIAGARSGLSTPVAPTPSSSTPTTSRQAIEDLKLIHDGCAQINGDHPESSGSLSQFAARMSGLAQDPDDLSRPRPNPPAVTGCERVDHSQEVIQRFQSIEPGKSDTISRFIRLHPDRPAPTIRAGTLSGHGSHTAPRPIHYDYPRCITVREAARLQSLPDWFQIDKTKWRGYMQVGNAVPALLARAVASAIMQSLRNISR